MKALTVQQPWAWAIAAGHKTVENRSWDTLHRGRVAIHAGRAWSTTGAVNAAVVDALKSEGQLFVSDECDPHSEVFAYGAVVAVAEIVGCHPAAGGCCAPWGEPDGWHWEIADARRLAEPVGARGQLGLWLLRPDLALRVEAYADAAAIGGAS